MVNFRISHFKNSRFVRASLINPFEVLIFVICKEFFHILNMDFIIYYKTIKFPKTTTIIVRTIIESEISTRELTVKRAGNTSVELTNS